uniref:Str_synth domain-containing protein n=1 Tax=Syphacia muris TaxID=451379 RepID=A0A0N5AZ25_9BILA
DRIYTGTKDGAIVEIKNGKISKKIRFAGGNCGIVNFDLGSYKTEPECGRPLGIRRLNKDELIVADAYLGIYTVNFEKNSFKQILDGKKIIDGKPMKFFNDIEVVNEDEAIFTVSSSKWFRRDFLKAVIENYPSGRVLLLTPSTGEVKVLMDNLYFANGIQLFEDKKSFIVAETTMARVLRHWISGPKAGKTEVFAENLPGLPDNIRQSTNGTFWVAINTIRRKTQFSMFDFLGDRTSLREIILKIVPNSYWPQIYKRVRPHHVMIVQLSKSGDIIYTAHDLHGAIISDISHVSDDGSYLYFGSVHSDYIARLSKNDL